MWRTYQKACRPFRSSGFFTRSRRAISYPSLFPIRPFLRSDLRFAEELHCPVFFRHIYQYREIAAVPHMHRCPHDPVVYLMSCQYLRHLHRGVIPGKEKVTVFAAQGNPSILSNHFFNHTDVCSGKIGSFHLPVGNQPESGGFFISFQHDHESYLFSLFYRQLQIFIYFHQFLHLVLFTLFHSDSQRIF